MKSLPQRYDALARNNTTCGATAVADAPTQSPGPSPQRKAVTTAAAPTPPLASLPAADIDDRPLLGVEHCPPGLLPPIFLAGPRAEQDQLLQDYAALAASPAPAPSTSTSTAAADQLANQLVQDDLSVRLDAQQSAVRSARTNTEAASKTLQERRLEARALQAIIEEDERRVHAYTDASDDAERQLRSIEAGRRLPPIHTPSSSAPRPHPTPTTNSNCRISRRADGSTSSPPPAPAAYSADRIPATTCFFENF